MTVDEKKEVPSEEAVVDVEAVAAHGDVGGGGGGGVGSVVSSVKEQILRKKKEERCPLGENIYSVLIVAPVISPAFLFSMSIVAIKLIVLVILCTDINFKELDIPKVRVTVVKFLLIPVAVAMQEDLMDSFFFFANCVYDKSVLQISASATKAKMYFSYFLRTIDGLLSLYVNYAVMLTTDDTISVFLNFAALQFLYSIDDVFYELISEGFFGDALEHMTVLCGQVEMARRYGKNNYKILFFRVSWLDTILFFFILTVCYIGYIVVTVATYTDNLKFDSESSS
jgi:hypothetical protein